MADNDGSASSDSVDMSIVLMRLLQKDAEVIDQGGYGIVYKLHSPLVIAKQFYRDDAKSFAREWEAMRMVHERNHPHIIKCLGAFLDALPVIVYEFAACGSLHHLLHVRGNVSYSVGNALDWAGQICCAVAFLHSLQLPDEQSSRPKPIMHRDLKPENILLFDDYKLLKVTDFGLARLDSSIDVTKRAGTVEYMAPEVYSSGSYTHQCDVFSFGVVFCEILRRGRPPRSLVAPNAFDPVPPVLQVVYRSCWIREHPELRPAMAQLENVLRNMLLACPDALKNTPVEPDSDQSHFPSPYGVSQFVEHWRANVL